ncbi:hypothetical protein [Subtercola lobariae]|uniref:Uncharacterized protein n=1 Tax=Subtercola lobariae TaxID=1588641 RepID=A0A917B716_9MICO|nr:hypothetical protein [Subtercola lobariae]GGF28446.1 hypothetical protein GCM10011399_22040 [Subtercola lobariae]
MEAVLAAIFAVIVVLAAAYRLLPGMLGPALILTWLLAAIWLCELARRRPYPTRPAKVAAFAAVSVFLIGYLLVVLVAMGVIDLHSTV